MMVSPAKLYLYDMIAAESSQIYVLAYICYRGRENDVFLFISILNSAR